MNDALTTDILPEYYDFIIFFDQNLFEPTYELIIKPTENDLKNCLELPNTFYNSFYMHSVIKHFLMHTKNIDNDLLRKICHKIFLHEIDVEKELLNIQNLPPLRHKKGKLDKNRLNSDLTQNLQPEEQEVVEKDFVNEINEQIENLRIENPESKETVASDCDIVINNSKLGHENVRVSIFEAKTIIEKLRSYYKNEKFTQHIHKLSNEILIKDSFNLNYFANFLEAFSYKNLVLDDHKCVIKFVLNAFTRNSIDFFMDLGAEEDDFNQNLDFLEVGLIAINKYLYNKNDAMDTNKLINDFVDNGVIKRAFSNRIGPSDNKTIVSDNVPAVSDNVPAVSDNGTIVSDNVPAVSDNGTIVSDNVPAVSDNGTVVSEKQTGAYNNETFAFECIDEGLLNAFMAKYNAYNILNQEISFTHEMFDFVAEYYRHMILQLKDLESLENDLYLIFKTSFSVFMLSSSSLQYRKLFKVLKFVILSKDFLISEELMLDLQKHIITNLKKMNNIVLSRNYLFLLLNSNAIIYLTDKNKSEFILHLIDNEILSEDQKHEIIKETDYNIETNLIFDIQNRTIKAEANKQIISVFLEYLSFFSSDKYFDELNEIFAKYLKRQNCINFYANFLARNDLKLPLWNYLPQKKLEESVNFCTIFFNKIKTNYDKRHKNSADKAVFGLILEKHVISFCNFFLQRRSELLVPVLNTFPFLPTKKDYIYIYYDIWCFIFDKEIIDDVLFFTYKTPPLIVAAEAFYKKHASTQYLKTRIYKKFRKETSVEFLSYANIEKYIQCYFTCAVFITEYAKFRNFNFTGIIAYIKDAQIIKYCFKELRYIVKLIHYKFILDDDYLSEYFICLLQNFDCPFESTKTLIIDILELIYKNNIMIIYNININIRFNTVLFNYHHSETKDNAIFDRLITFYKSRFIDNIQKNCQFFYNYMMSCICDFTLFNEYKCIGKGRFLDVIKSANDNFNLMNAFVDACRLENVSEGFASHDNEKFGTKNSINEYENLFYANENGNFTQNVAWFIDVVYLNRNETKIVRKIINICQKRLYLRYNYEDLYIILKIYNVLGIREQETDFLVRRSLTKGVDYNISYDLMKEISEQTDDFFSFYFYNLYFISNFSFDQDKNLQFPVKKSLYASFSKSDLIKIHNIYRQKITSDILSSAIFSHREYFIDINSLSVMDILVVLMNSNKKDLTNSALSALKSKDVLFYIPQIVQVLKTRKFFIDLFVILLDLCKDEHVCHFLIWNLKSNLNGNCDVFRRCLKDLEGFCAEQESLKNLSVNKGASKEDNPLFAHSLCNKDGQEHKPKDTKIGVNNCSREHHTCNIEIDNRDAHETKIGKEDTQVKDYSCNVDKNAQNLDGRKIDNNNDLYKCTPCNKDNNNRNLDDSKIDEDKERQQETTGKSSFTAQMKFFNSLTNVSALMMPYLKDDKELKRSKINAFLGKVEHPGNIYLPTDPSYEILSIVPDSGRVLQSHAKVPFMASFYCRSINTDHEVTKNETVIKHLIFKAGDDCRQDMLAIQLITIFKNIFKDANLDLFLFPYKVIATGLETGIIEVIPNAITRDQMGREKINNLVDYFEFKYGYKEGFRYKTAANNFVRSLAGYSLVTYFLNIQDRHNGNIMIDDSGHIIHIDFGFMFELHPGIGIEIPLKLTKEVYDLLSISNLFEKYIDLMIKGFFALRRNSKDIVYMVDCFKDSGLPCYKRNAVENFIGRFKFGLNDEEAKTFMRSLIIGSIRKVRTWVYDKFQEMTNNIAF